MEYFLTLVVKVLWAFPCQICFQSVHKHVLTTLAAKLGWYDSLSNIWCDSWPVEAQNQFRSTGYYWYASQLCSFHLLVCCCLLHHQLRTWALRASHVQQVKSRGREGPKSLIERAPCCVPNESLGPLARLAAFRVHCPNCNSHWVVDHAQACCSP